MPGFTEVRIRLEDKDVIPYIRWAEDTSPFRFSIMGLDPIKQYLRLPPPTTDEPAPPDKSTRKGIAYVHTYGRRLSMRKWLKVYDLIKAGHKLNSELITLAGYAATPHNIVRLTNTLRMKGYIKGNDGTYTVVKELNEAMIDELR